MKALLLPSLSCNRSCSYCYLHSKKTKDAVAKLEDGLFRSADDWMNGLEFFEREYGKIDSVDISGGEPFRYRDMMKLLEMLIDRYGRVNLTTNMDLVPDEFFELPKDKVFVTVSFHLNNGGWNKPIISKIDRLRQSGMPFSVNYVSEESQILLFDRVKSIANNVFNANAHLEPYVDYNLDKTFFGIPKDEFKKEYFYNNISPLEHEAIKIAKLRGIDEPKKIQCDVSKTYVVFASNGDVFPCLGMMFEGRELVANIFSKIQIMTRPHTIECDVFCPCAQNYRDGFI